MSVWDETVENEYERTNKWWENIKKKNKEFKFKPLMFKEISIKDKTETKINVKREMPGENASVMIK